MGGIVDDSSELGVSFEKTGTVERMDDVLI